MPRSAVARPCRTTECVDARAEGRRRSDTRWGAVALAALSLAGAAPVAAHAQEPTGGTSPDLPRPPAEAPEPSRAQELAPPPTANLYGKPAPRIKRFSCRSSCGAGGAARPGSLIRVRGRNVGPLDEVVFLGAAGEADDTSVAPRRVRRRSALARVPRTAVSGAIALVRPDGTRSPASARQLTVEPQPVDVPAGTIDAEVQGSKVFFGARREAELSYVVGGSRPASVRVELVRAAGGAVVEQWAPGDVQPGVPQTVRWDGTVDGEVQRDGVYQFRVTATDAAGVRASSSAAGSSSLGAPGASTARDDAPSPGAPGAFKFLRYRFPLIGAHHYGEHGAAFGGGRGHQGQDVFAACGTPIVAARGGVVKFKEFQSAAGNYVVIDGASTGVDFGYMHLREAALVEEGERVRTGQPIGFVGATGRASGCHLHFEEWTAPGWYSGGSAFDPLPDLRAWDARS
jgi:murein DD-endopeptidase MepM/ murein hydrolase activator NlpD